MTHKHTEFWAAHGHVSPADTWVGHVLYNATAYVSRTAPAPLNERKMYVKEHAVCGKAPHSSTIFPQVAANHAQASLLEVTNTHLATELGKCENKSKEAADEAAKQLQRQQTTHDDQVGVRSTPQRRGRRRRTLPRRPDFRSNVRVHCSGGEAADRAEPAEG